MKKKIIAIFAIFILSFNIMVSARQEKTEASSLLLSYVIFKAGVSFTAFTGFASLMAVNGYHMQLSDLAVSFANKYYDYANGVYTQKGSKINVLEKLSLATASFLSGNDPLSLSDLEEIKNDIVTEYPTVFDVEKLNITTEYDKFLAIPYTQESNFYVIDEAFKNKVYKLNVGTGSTNHVYIDTTVTGWAKSGSWNLPIISLITPFGDAIRFPMKYNQIRTSNYDSDDFLHWSQTTNSQMYLKELIAKIPNLINGLVREYEVIADSFATNLSDFKLSYPNYYPALSGKAATTDELIGLMNTDEYLQREVAKLLENQKVNEQNTLEIPTVVDGVITYPTADIPDIPDVPYSPTETWYNNLLGWVSNIPDLLIGGITDLFNDTLIPALDSLKDIVIQIPDLLTNIWQWILDFPDLLYSWFVPTAPMIAETWDPVMDLWDLKLDPIIAPFKTLTFYETEYQDISVPLKFGSYEKEHKIIDFQYIKSQRDTIKSLIRAFLWILIIFFNLDQIHRLIRNQSLLNTYVRKIDKGA